MRRILCALLVFALFFPVCPAAASGLEKISVFTPYFPPFSDEAALEALEQRLGVTLEWPNLPYDQYDFQLDLLIASDQTPDLFSVSLLGDENILKAAAPLTQEEIREYMPAIYESICQRAAICGLTAEKLLSDWSIDGEIQCFTPGKFEGTLPDGIVIRTDVLDALGFSMPLSISDWDALLRAYKQAHPQAYPISCIGKTDKDAFAPFLSAYGVVRDEWSFQGGLLQYAPFLLGMRDGLIQLAQWYEDDLIPPLYFERYAMENAQEASFISGETFFLPGVSLDTSLTPPYPSGSVLGTVYQNDPQAAFAWAPYPLFASYDAASVKNAFPFSGPYLCLGAHLQDDLPKKHRVMRFLDQLLSDSEAYSLYRDAAGQAEPSAFFYSPLDPVFVLCRERMPAALLENIKTLVQPPDGIYSRRVLHYVDMPRIPGALTNAVGMDLALKNEPFVTQWDAIFTSIVIGMRRVVDYDTFILSWKRSVGYEMMEIANSVYLKQSVK